MSRFWKIIIAALLLGGSAASAQQLITFSVSVSEENTNKPVPFHPVFVSANDSLFLNTYLTDEDGFITDSLFVGGVVIISLNFMTFDCNGLPHDTTFYTFNQPLDVEFRICTDSIPIGCLANFNAVPQGTEPFTFQFTDISQGVHDQWLWDFGDSTFSLEPNPVHTFPSEGEYYVCLTITGSDSLQPCFDTYCQPVLVGPGQGCTANFSFQLDSLSIQPNLYQFFDQSTGNIDSWTWDFGDGNFSTEQNPVHQYADSGSYRVCLSIANSSNPNQCGDTWCDDLSTPAYYNLGGLAWLGDFPMNNPIFGGDTGIVSLYRLSQGQLIFIQDRHFSENGYFWFTSLLAGDYITKLRLTPSSPNYPGYLPSYHGDQVNWEAALPVHLLSDQYEAHIHLVPVAELSGGPGTISGSITYEGFNPAGSGQQTTVILADELNNPLRFAEPEPSGTFSFQSLPFGTYLVKADLPGRPSEPQLILLTPNSPTASYVALILNESGFYGMEEKTPEPVLAGHPYPNPASSMLHIDINTSIKQSGTLIITNMMGQILLHQSMAVDEGSHTFSLDISALPDGLFVLQIMLPDLRVPLTRKFIK